MTFADFNVAFSDLRDGLRAQVGPKAIGDLNIRPPAGDAEEASFLRLISWCFVLLFEAGRISIPFLLDLNFPEMANGDAERHKRARAMVQNLRTFQSHNLGFDDGHDLDIRKAVSDWFVETCKVIYPTLPEEWRACFQRLCKDVHALLAHCSAILSIVAATSEDRDLIFPDLLRRLDRDWEAHQFDRMIEDSAARLGEKVNIRSFRDRRIGDWRKYLSILPDDQDPVVEMERLIDGEIANHFRSQLPIRTQELMESLGLNPGPEVKRAIEITRRIFDSGIRDRTELLSRVRAEFETAET